MRKAKKWTEMINVENVLRKVTWAKCTKEDADEQCTFHMTDNQWDALEEALYIRIREQDIEDDA